MTSELDTKIEQCAHRWVLSGGPNNGVKCVLCPAERAMTETEIARVETAQRAGTIFLKWPEGAGRDVKRRKVRESQKSPDAGPKQPRAQSAVQTGDSVPEGFITPQEYAKLVGWEDKKVRKMARAGRIEATKVGGHVYVRAPSK